VTELPCEGIGRYFKSSEWLTVSQDRKRLAHDAQGQRVVCARCFRFGGKKEAAGAAVAVIQAGIMGIECYFMIG
jgi:hypothetical protein